MEELEQVTLLWQFIMQNWQVLKLLSTSESRLIIYIYINFTYAATGTKQK